MTPNGVPPRDLPSWRRKLRVALRRLKRARGTPHDVALGFALATFLSILPTPGMSILIGFALAAFLRISKIGLAVGFAAFNPFVCVFLIYPWALPIGKLIIDRVPWIDFEHLRRFQWAAEQGTALLVGSIVAGFVIGIACYFLVRRVVVAYRERKAAREHARWLRRHPHLATAEIDGE